MSALVIIGFAVICAILSVFLYKQSPAFSLLISLAGCIVVLLYTLSGVRTATEMFARLAVGAPTEEFTVLLKILGLTILKRTAQDVCLDAGQRALAGKIDLCARVAMILVAVPLLGSVMNVLTELLT